MGLHLKVARILFLIAILGAIGATIFLQTNPRETPPVSENADSVVLGEMPAPQATSSDKVIPAPPRVEIPPVLIPPLPPAPPPPEASEGGQILPPASEGVAPPIPPPEPPPQPPSPPPLPPLNEQALFNAVVKIQCPTADGRGKYIGSGFALSNDTVVTAAHVVMDSASETCEVIFPNKDRRPVHYLRGAIQDFGEVKKRHDEDGIDVAVLKLPPLESYPEARAIFSQYPAIPYPVCENPKMRGDKLLHFGYPSNFLDQNYLSKLDGELITYADIGGVKEQLSQDGTYTFQSPIFKYTNDESRQHPYIVSRVPSFYGDSGGLAFNAAKQCILGPHRGGTIGRGAGENYSVFMMLGWERVRILLP